MPEREEKSQGAVGPGPQGQAASAFEPGGPDAAQAQAAELSGVVATQSGSAEQQAKEAAEEARQAKALADWQAFLGEKLGAKVYEKVHELVGFEALRGHAKKAVDSLGDALADGPLKPTEAGKLGGLMDEEAEAEALNKLVAALEPQIRAAALEWLESEDGQKLLRAVGDWTEEHPVATTTIIATVLVGGAIAAYLANLEIPELKKTFKLGRGFEADIGVQLGKLQEIAIEAVTVKLSYETEGLEASLTGLYSEEHGVSATASISTEAGSGSSRGKASADVTVGGEDELRVRASGELHTLVGKTPLSAKAGASHTAKESKTRIEGSVTLGEEGETRSLSGFYSPTDDSFELTLGQTTDDGKLTRAQSFGQNAAGELTSEDSLTYRPDDRLKLSYSEGMTGDAARTRFGLALDTGRFETELGYEMEGAKETLGLTTAYDLDDYRFSLDGEYDLSDRRLGELGARVGWRDPKEFKSWSLGYRAKYEADNPGYEHTFDTALEYSLGTLAGRLKGEVSMDGQGVSGAEADLLVGKRLGDSDFSVLGGVGYTNQRGAGGMESDFSARAGLQYKNIGVTAGRRFDSGENFIQLEMTLFRW